MHPVLSNLRLVYSNPRYILLTVLAAAPLAYLFYYFTSLDIIAGNMGVAHAGVQVILQALMVPLFGVNVALAVYRFNAFRNVEATTGTFAFVGTFAGSLVAGCPACSVTLASVLGVGTVLSGLPFYGTELLVAGILLLGYSTYTLARDLTVCKVKRRD